jgi:molybdopterin converting factor small subunit
MPAVAVNCEYVPASRTLSPDDEVAFLPPIAGG